VSARDAEIFLRSSIQPDRLRFVGRVSDDREGQAVSPESIATYLPSTTESRSTVLPISWVIEEGSTPWQPMIPNGSV